MSAIESAAELSARERLTRSRERMSYWLADEERDGHPRTRANGQTSPEHSEGISVGGIISEVVSEWWAEHPLHASASLALAASRTAIVPLVRRHPAAVLGGAALVGAALIWARPWRFLLRPAVLAGVASQLTARALARMATASRPVA